MRSLLHNIISIFKIIIKVYTGYYLIYGSYFLLLKIVDNKRNLKFPKLYVKEFPFHLNRIAVHRLRIFAQFIFTILSTSTIVFIFLIILAPLGVTTYYSSEKENLKTPFFGPINRIKEESLNGVKIVKQIDDLIYFTTNMPYQYERAKVRIIFQNKDDEQTISLGFKDEDVWHYSTKLIDAPPLNKLNWNKIGKSPFLYQKDNTYKNIGDFLKKPPKDALIGTYSYIPDIGNTSFTRLSQYKPENKETIITTPFRGSLIMYAYLDHEPFHMKIQKQDLNWYEDPDTMTIKVYKGDEQVFQKIADDDGIADASKKVLPPQQISIDNPGPGLPESGVYKIVIDSSGESLIKKISTNLHKIVFAGSIFLAGNKEAYGQAISSTSATTLYTNALLLTASAIHNSGEQDISVDRSKLRINSLKLDHSIIPKEDLSTVTIPKNDIILKGFQGYFSFTKDQFFLPTQYHIIPITQKEDIDLVNYILTDYIPSKEIGDWKIAERNFDIRKANINNGKLSWVIQAPKLKDNKRSITIKSIDITFYKDSLFK